MPNVQKLNNLKRDSRVALSIVDSANDYRYLEVRGRVTEIEPDPHYTHLSKLARIYWGLETYPYPDEGSESVIIVIEPVGTSRMNLTPPAKD